MLIVSFNELSEDNIKYHLFVVPGNRVLRFCVDILHDQLVFGTEKEDHIACAGRFESACIARRIQPSGRKRDSGWQSLSGS
ncbi:hypothetical protein HY490_03800, partial [Candidatus Woesearchaeota archaeon]|nr:hypothetical protein [Candidatus Woesearchaeota archaeon]